MTAVKVNKRTFCLWYHSARSPVTCQCNKRDMYEPKRKISPFMAKQDTSAARRCPVRPVGAYFLDNDRRSIHYPLHIQLYFSYPFCLRHDLGEAATRRQFPGTDAEAVEPLRVPGSRAGRGGMGGGGGAEGGCGERSGGKDWGWMRRERSIARTSAFGGRVSDAGVSQCQTNLDILLCPTEDHIHHDGMCTQKHTRSMCDLHQKPLPEI